MNNLYIIFIVIYLFSCTPKEASSNRQENVNNQKDELAERKENFFKFESKFPTLTLPYSTNEFKIANDLELDTSVTKDFVPAIFHTSNTISPIGKLVYNEYYLLLWKEMDGPYVTWQLATFFPSSDPLDQVELKRTTYNFKLESVLEQDLSVTSTINDLLKNTSKNNKFTIQDGRITFPDSSTIEDFNYLSIKDKSNLTKPIQFKKGSNFSLIHSKILPNSNEVFKFYAKKGQQCQVKLVANNSFLYFGIDSKDSSIFSHGIDTYWNGVLPRTGEYLINVGLMRVEERRRKAKIDYTLYVSID